jgi:predicted N-formylglutamate amidohydrolase
MSFRFLLSGPEDNSSGGWLAMKYGTEAVLTPIPQAMNINVLDGELMTDFDNQGTDVNGSLCGASEPAPFELIAVPPQRPALIVCDHAAARIPASLGTLGLRPASLADHIALDIGAAAMTRALSEQLGLPAVLTAYSRLVVDCNRRLDDPTAFPPSSDGVAIPGNTGLDDGHRAARSEALYWPYHHQVRDQLTSLESLGAAPALIAVHSFTPSMNGLARPWEIGILWDKDPRIPVALMDRLRARGDIQVGDNEPYSGKHPADFTVDHHAEAEGLPHVSIEIRQDLITTQAGIDRWSGLLAESLAPLLDDPQLYCHWSG